MQNIGKYIRRGGKRRGYIALEKKNKKRKIVITFKDIADARGISIRGVHTASYRKKFNKDDIYSVFMYMYGKRVKER